MVKLEEPDKGQAWVIAIAVCLVNFILLGLSKMGPLLYVAVIATYGVSRESAAEPFAVAEAIRLLGGPITGVIGQRFGVKTTTFVGGIISSLGIAFSWFAPNVFWLTIFWGGLFGFGFGLATTLYPVLINQYFVKYRATASGIAMCGANIGAFVLPFIINAAQDAFGLSGGFLILSGISMHVLPLSLLLKSPQWLENPKQYARLEALKMKQQTSGTLEKGLPEENKKVHVQECRVIKLQSSLDNSSLEELDKSSVTRSLKENMSRKNSSNSSGTGDIISAEKSHAFLKPTIAGELGKKQNNFNPSATCEKTYEAPSVKKTSLLESIRGIGTLYTNPPFVLINVCMGMFSITYVSTTITIVDYGKDKRISESCGICIVNSMAVGSVIGKLCLGWITDKKILSISTYLAMTFILKAVIIFLLPLVMNLYLFMLLLVLCGATMGTVMAHFPLLILLYVDKNLQSVALGCEGFLSGIVCFTVPKIVGYFRDDVGSYDGMFYLTGTMDAVSGCFWLLIPPLVEFQRKKAEQSKMLQEKVKMEELYKESKSTIVIPNISDPEPENFLCCSSSSAPR